MPTSTAASATVSEAVARTRAEVCALHAELVTSNLVAWTAGNVSARVPGADLMVIKPSGVAYPDLTPENMVVCDLDGRGGRRLAEPVRAIPDRTPTCTGICPG